ncbi:hypothetical protein ACH4JS_31445 [Streptomyces sp. NPDC017638]
MSGCFDDEQGDLVRPYVVGVARRLAENLARDDFPGAATLKKPSEPLPS